MGAALPLSGDFATYGQVIRDGIQLAAKDLRESGIEIETFFEDAPLPGNATITSLRKLIDQDRVSAIAGNFFNPNMTIMAPILLQRKIPAFHTAIVDDTIAHLNPYIFGINASVTKECELLVAHLKKNFGAPRIAIIYAGTQWGEAYNTNIVQQAKKFGLETVSAQMVALDERDLRAELSKTKASSAEVLVIALFGPQLGIALTQASDLGIKTPIVATYEIQDASVLSMTGRLKESVTFFVPEPSIDSDNRRQFKRAFSTTYGYAPPILSSNSYDSTILLGTALHHCGGVTECVQKYLEQPRQIDGASGQFSTSGKFSSKEFTEKLLVRGEVFVKVGKGN